MSITALVHSRSTLADAAAKLSARQIAWLVFLLTLLTYWSLVPWVARRWWLTGDEPHYLVLTHSLLTDGDLELSDNYQEKDFTLFYVVSELDPHVKIGPDGGAYPAHTIGLSVAVLPAYALGRLACIGHAGVLYFLTATGALLAANIYLLSYEVTGRRFLSLLGWVAIAFTVPVMHYSFRVYPEIMGALLLAWSLRHIRRGGQTKTHIWFIVGTCIGFLPWLASRFILLSAFLGAVSLFSVAVGAADARRRRLRILALCLPVVVLGGLLLGFNYHFYGSAMPSGGTADASQVRASLVHTSVEKLTEGLVGWALDQHRGLLVYTPLYVMALPGLLLLLRDRRRDAIFLGLPVAVTYLFLGWQGFWLSWDLPVRYLVCVLPLLAVPVAYGVERVRSRSFTGVGLALFLVSVTTGVLLMADPDLVYAHRIDGRSGLLEVYERWVHVDISQYVPYFVTHRTVIYAHERPLNEAAEIGKTVTDPLAEGQDGGVPSTGQVIWAERGTQGAGYVLDRVWPSSEYIAASPAGVYSACFRMRAGFAESAEATLAVVEVSTSEGVLAVKEIATREFPTGDYGVSCLQFDHPGHQRLKVRVLFADQADLWIDWVMITGPAGSATWIISGFWLAVVAAITGYYYVRSDKRAGDRRDQSQPGELHAADRERVSAFGLASGLLIALTVVTIMGGHLSRVLIPRSFEAEELPRLTGEVVMDEEASGGKAAHASGDVEMRALVYGPYEFFRPGRYAARFRIKAGGSSADTAATAIIDVHGAASGTLAEQTVESTDFQEVERYQEFRLLFSNPAYQALQFRVIPLGSTDLWVDKITVEKALAGQG